MVTVLFGRIALVFCGNFTQEGIVMIAVGKDKVIFESDFNSYIVMH